MNISMKCILPGLILVASMLSLPAHAFGICNKLKSSDITFTTTTKHNGALKYLSFTPKKGGKALTMASISNSRISVAFNNCFQQFNVSGYNGVEINMHKGGGRFSGKNLDFHQLVNGGSGNDVIVTGPATDYVYGNAGSDKIYTGDGFETVDGGAGYDCVEQGNSGSIPSKLTNVEQTASCADFVQFKCSGLSANNILVNSNTTYNAQLNYLALSPNISSQELKVSGDESQITVEYANECQVIETSNYDGVLVTLTDGNESYNGSDLAMHQVVIGGTGNDKIITGSKIDYVMAGNGDDVIYTYGDYERVDGGQGFDCVTQGSEGSISSNFSNLESYDCEAVGGFDDLPAALANKYENCTSQDQGFTTEKKDSRYFVHAQNHGITLNVEEHDEYIFVYSKDYDHCSVSSGIELVDVNLTNGNDVLDARSVSVNLTVYGLAGNDSIKTGSGHDLVFGGSGNDTIEGNDGNDWLAGDSKLETDRSGLIYAAYIGQGGSDGSDKLYGGRGEDILFGNGNNDTLLGQDNDDIIFGNSGGRDKVYGNSGADILVDSGATSWSNRAKLWGGSGQDILVCEAGECELRGGGNNDFLAGINESYDIGLYGGNGKDVLFVRNDKIPSGSGGSGADFCYNATRSNEVCNVLRSVNRRTSSGSYFDDAVRDAARRMNAQHERTMNLANFKQNPDYSKFKKDIADLVRESVFKSWLEDRSKTVYDLN